MLYCIQLLLEFWHLNGLNVFTAVALMLHMYLGLKLCSIHQLELVNINYQMQI